ncbi:MAG: DNA-binding response regulator [Lysobacteraceae bacterium]|nr:MAG: DNA-binding response regulator [Xanthomonadaceae bacterium]
MRILLVEDDQKVADYIVKGLNEFGHTVDTADNGNSALYQAIGEDYDVLVVDRMLPQMDGLAVIRALRAAGRKTPVLVLSALAQVDDRVEGLRAGGDDYLTKPFAFAELMARIEALNRRQSDDPTHANGLLVVGDLIVDIMAHNAKRKNQTIELQPREFRLLVFLMRHAGQVVTRTMLLEHVWDYHFDPQTNVIDVHISRLRRKIDRNFDKPLLHTVRGAGYKIDANP